MTGRILKTLEPRRLETGPHVAERDGQWTHWRLSRDDGNIAWLLLDRQGTGVNVLSSEVIEELGKVLANIEASLPAALALRSAKPAGFCAGADLREFRGLTDTAEIEARLRKAHDVVDRLAALPCPTIAVIHGLCLGGGLELVLACDRRIVVDGTTLGFPEVRLGLHPGLGGTARATHLIDPTRAMTLMLTGKTIDAAEARDDGLVDVVTPERHVRNAVRAMAGRKPGRSMDLKSRVFDFGPARSAAARRMRSKTAGKARAEQYPSPYALIDLWERHGSRPEAMREAEIDSFARLLVGDTARNLVRAFFLREGLKKLANGKTELRHVHVVGAGTMGGDIAAWCALQGLRVTLSDLDSAAIAGAVRRAAVLYGRKLRSRAGVLAALDRLVPDPKNVGIAAADVVIEAVAEKTQVKHAVFREIEPQLNKDAILATNTSSIPLETLGEALKRPNRLVGLHFFNPVSRMQLIEVVRHDGTDRKSISTAVAFVERISRLPAPVTSAPGFLVNRALTPYLLEAITMLDEGVDPETLDSAAEAFGMPMGPIELADQVGLDICVDVADMLSDRLERQFSPIPGWLRDKVEAGDLGRKSGRGLYPWKDGKAQKKSTSSGTTNGAVTDRMLLPMVDACVACLQQGVVADEETLDGAMIFATGFAPFRGGPMRYARDRGIDDIVAALGELEHRHGERFAPDPGWDALS